ncbi:hypothetical protein D3C76_1462830 [compost metagenome]
MIPREVPITLLSLPPILLPMIPPVITPNVVPIFSFVPMFSQDVRVRMGIVRAKAVRISLFIVFKPSENWHAGSLAWA